MPRGGYRVEPGREGHDGAAYTEEHEARYEAAEDKAEAMMTIDLEVWAPLGADERIRELGRATPDANPLPDGVEPLDPPGAPAKERLGELAGPPPPVTAPPAPAGVPPIRPIRGGARRGTGPPLRATPPPASGAPPASPCPPPSRGLSRRAP